ncbi:glycoside hydrolase family 18 protein [Paxillus involutus ATCC 200175]|nr:glycoside hydrolase family 18 protein [Paxillus involutus ATCC 200175]
MFSVRQLLILHSYVVYPHFPAYPKFNALNQPLGGAWDDAAGTDICGVYQGPGGNWDFWGLVDGRFLTSEGDPAPGIYYRYKSCSQTPYVYNEASLVMISFDNADSFVAKGSHIRETGLRHFSIWEAGGDYDGDTWNFWALVKGGFLTSEGAPAPGIDYRFDSCSQTPYVYNETSQVMISFDNADSFAAKGNYIKETGLRGFAMWEAAGDYDDILLDSIGCAAGFD